MSVSKKSNSKRKIVDAAMTVVLLFLMAYQVTGEAAHEWIGVSMTILVIVHQILNRRWYSALSEYIAGSVFCHDGVLRHVHERVCGAFYVRIGAGFLRAENAPVHVPLGLCADGAAPRNAHPCNDGRPEVERPDQEHAHRPFHVCRRARAVLVYP